MHHIILTTPLFRIINDQVMEVEAIKSTTCNLVQELVCLKDIEEGRVDVVSASAESATDEQFLQPETYSSISLYIPGQ